MTIHDVTPDRILSSVSLSEPGRAFLAGEPAAMEPVGDRTGAREIGVDPDDIRRISASMPHSSFHPISVVCASNQRFRCLVPIRSWLRMSSEYRA